MDMAGRKWMRTTKAYVKRRIRLTSVSRVLQKIQQLSPLPMCEQRAALSSSIFCPLDITYTCVTSPPSPKGRWTSPYDEPSGTDFFFLISSAIAWTTNFCFIPQLFEDSYISFSCVILVLSFTLHSIEFGLAFCRFQSQSAALSLLLSLRQSQSAVLRAHPQQPRLCVDVDVVVVLHRERESWKLGHNVVAWRCWPADGGREGWKCCRTDGREEKEREIREKKGP